MALFGTSAGFGSLFGPLNTQQNRFQPQIIGLGNNLLAGAFSSQSAIAGLRTLSAEDRASFNFRGASDAVIPPWKLPEETKTLNQQVREVRELTKFIDLTTSDLRGLSQDVDTQATFAIFKALSNLRVLAEYASQDATSNSSLGRLNDQFQSGLTEVREFLSTANLQKLDLFLGDKEYKAEASTRTGKNSTESNHSVVTNDPTAAIAGLTGTEVFTVSITKSGVTDDIAVDLAGVTGTLSLNNIKDHINATIEALTIDNGSGTQVPKHLTRFDVQRDTASGQYGFQIEGTLTEEVKLSAAVAEPTLYVASAVSQLDDSFATTSRITELNGLSATITVDDTTSFAGIDYAATEIKEKVDNTTADTIDPELAALRDKIRLDALKDVTGNVDATLTVEADNALSLTNVNSDFQVNADTTASRVATDSEGGIYVVGTSKGSFEHQINTATAEDVFLSKFDNEGNLLFTRLLGAAGSADAYGITVDSADNVIIVGKTDSELSTSDVIDTTDAFVTKISKRGDEIFRYQLDKFGESAAYTVAVDSNDDIFVGGYTKSAISSTSGFGGGKDALILKLDGTTGTLTDSNVFGTSANEVIKGIAVDANDNLVVAAESSGNAIVYRIDGTDLTNQTASVDFGNLGSSGSLEGIAIDNTNGAVYISGVTINAALDASGSAAVNGSALGAQEGFVSGLTLSGTTALTADFTTYLSTSGTDRIQDVVVNNGTVYVAGSTSGTLSGELKRGSVDAFAARINGTSGALEDVQQFGEGLAKQATGGLAFTTQGNSVLETLGLPTGTVGIDETLDVQTQTSAKVGDFFYLTVDGGSKRKITLEDSDTFEDIKRKIRIAGFGKLSADVATTSEGSKLTISTLDNGSTIDLLPGKGDRDLLQRIGLTAGKLVPKNEALSLLNNDKNFDPSAPENLGGAFGLGLAGALNIEDKQTAKYVLGLLDGGISRIQRAFRSLTFDPLKESLKNGNKTSGPVPPHLQKQLANFSSGLARLQSGSSSSSTSLFV